MTGRKWFIIGAAVVISIILGFLNYVGIGPTAQGILTLLALGVGIWAGYEKWEPRPLLIALFLMASAFTWACGTEYSTPAKTADTTSTVHENTSKDRDDDSEKSKDHDHQDGKKHDTKHHEHGR